VRDHEFHRRSRGGPAIRRQGIPETGAIPSLGSRSRVRANPIGTTRSCSFAVDEDPGFGMLCAYVQDDVNARYVTPHLIATLLCGPDGAAPRDVSAILGLRGSDCSRWRSRRRHWTGVQPLGSRAISDYLRGINRLDDQVADAASNAGSAVAGRTVN
jgi:hypothetical protein